MIPVSVASDLIDAHRWKPESELLPLGKVLGRVLAEPVFADRDLPPYERVAMDGIAISYTGFESGINFFRVAGMASAGMAAVQISDHSDCIEVMTGAILPIGADVVVRYEDITIEGGYAKVNLNQLHQWMNIHRQGSDARSADQLLQSGLMISSAEIPLLASVGKAMVAVCSLPRTAIISTGDELIDIKQVPLDHQIRISNSYALQAGLSVHHVSSDLFHMNDQRDANVSALKKILTDYDLIVLSGGVSKGKFDWVPKALEEAGVQRHFHQVNQKPGKPLWFGSGSGKVVFALPGNPVSTYLCLYRYILPWLRSSLGLSAQMHEVQLMHDYEMKLESTYFLQVKIVNEGGVRYAIPVPGGGSGDFVNLLHTDGFIEIPAGKKTYPSHSVFPYYPFRII
jgi:molybdopterin molybdotransferase